MKNLDKATRKVIKQLSSFYGLWFKDNSCCVELHNPSDADIALLKQFGFYQTTEASNSTKKIFQKDF